MALKDSRHILAYALIVVLGMAAAHYLGKDYNWDSLSYHVYAGYNAIENRLAADYFAASTQGYLNPYSHVPFYLMLKQGLAPQLVVALLALFHVLNLLIVYEIALLLNRRRDGTTAWVPVGLAVFFAFCNPVFILELGNTFNEITTSVPVLAGWYLLVREFHAPRRNWVALAGLLIGIAVALKLTNLFFSVTALPLLLLAPGSWKARAQSVLVFALAGLAGVLLAGGWWAWQIWEQFGNPFFPLFNNIFHAPDFTDGALKHYRFIPASFAELLLKPFYMALPNQGIHIEMVGPDLRYAALVILLALFAVKSVLGRPGVGKWSAAAPFPAFEGQRLLAALGLGVALAWGMWVLSSGNSRYFLPMSCLASVILATLLFRFTGRPRFLVYASVALVLLQTALAGFGSDRRWTPAGWGASWFELDIPPPLLKEPSLYLHLSALPASFMLPFLAPRSSMMNVSGQYVVKENARTRALMEKYRGRTRVMKRFSKDQFTADDFNVALVRFRLEADLDTCLSIRFVQRHGPGEADTYKYYISCKTKPLSWPAERFDAYLASKRRMDEVFGRLELMCPHIFQPRGLESEGNGKQFWRNYGNTDTVLEQHGNGLVTYRNVFTNKPEVKVGMIDVLEKALPAKAAVCP